MPEGDSIFRLARTLARGLAGQTVVKFTSVLPALTRIDEDHPIAGRTIEAVAARGKHLLMTFSRRPGPELGQVCNARPRGQASMGSLTLHTHMRMNGMWQLYQPGERWRRAARDMRIVVATADAEAVGFNIPVAEWLTAPQLARHEQLRNLGPDLLGEAFDPADAVRRAAPYASSAVGDLLLNQRVVAGIGNVLKSESLFVARINPFVPASQLTATELTNLLSVAQRLIRMSVLDSSSLFGGLVAGGGRRTFTSLDPNARLWVYGRSGKPCRQCGTAIVSRKTGLDARVTYWCPRCQPAPRGKEAE
jgi:endonuclease-8